MTNKPILIIGLHRSGTTWLAKILSLPREVKYISEPFNPNTGLKSFTRWMIYINNNNGDKYFSDIEKLFRFRGDLHFTLPNIKYLANRFWPGQKRILMKGIGGAVFSTNWLVEKFDMQVVAIMRHPAAFYASLKRLNWRFDFDNLLSQSDLMADYLEPFRQLMEKKNMSFSEEAAVLWLCVNYVLDKYIGSHPECIFKRHEDLSLNPIEEFRDIYNKLGLNFNAKIEQQINKFSNSGNKAEAEKNKAVELKRNSQAIVKNWKKHVSSEEIKIIKDITGELALKYYPENDW
ncbi:MAG: sulfotransferase [Candidatus Buchananbacteria bacterium]|nr:sulfotransferase [Candidatus Buchananbacteria bacterium]